jgi:Spy/CpxP family protein refolding chaperone
MKNFTMILCTLLWIGLAGVVCAAPPDSGPPGPPGAQGFHKDHGPALHHEFHSPLNLSQEQRAKMREIRERFLADTHDLRYDMAEKRIEMRKLFTNPKTDDASLLAKHKEVRDIMLKLMDRKAQMKIEWRKVLNPEQIKMLDRPFRHPHHFMHGDGQGPQCHGPAGQPE